jgi:hypothetical protein
LLEDLGVKKLDEDDNARFLQKKIWACAETIHTGPAPNSSGIIPFSREYHDPVTGVTHKAGFPTKRHIFNFPDEPRPLTQEQEQFLKQQWPIKTALDLAKIIWREKGHRHM